MRAALFFFAVAMLGVIVYAFTGPKSVLVSKPLTGSQESPPAQLKPQIEREAMVFQRVGESALIVAEVDRVIGPGKSSAARTTRDGATWICVLVDDVGPWMGPDPHWSEDVFPELQKFQFIVPPPPVMRTLSIYRSVIWQKLKLTEKDRVLILVLPKERWSELRPSWPIPNDTKKN